MDERPMERKPMDERPMESKAMDERPMESKAMDERPMESKAMDERPTESKAMDEWMMESKAMADKSVSMEPEVAGASKGRPTKAAKVPYAKAAAYGRRAHSRGARDDRRNGQSNRYLAHH
jgi:ribonuclease E